MKDILVGIISGLVTATALFAGARADASPDPVASWVQTTREKIEHRMVYPTSGEAGIVFATFQRGDDGHPTAIVIRSASAVLMRSARVTLDRVNDLPPLPAGYANRRIRLQMLVGNPSDAAEFYTRRKQLLAAEKSSNAQLVDRLRPVLVSANAVR